jgi:alcohol dehydrogenase YqhD (iron-dependent ADH family)
LRAWVARALERTNDEHAVSAVYDIRHGGGLAPV